LAKLAGVIDSDTLEICGTRTRLHGIDAPERNQSCRTAVGSSWPCGLGATRALANGIGHASAACTECDMDGYGHVVAVCRFKGTDLNRWMVTLGHALLRLSGLPIGLSKCSSNTA